MPPNSKFCPTQSEFEAFPPTLKRKYFSTLERLRYAEAQAQTDFPSKSDNMTKTISRKLISNRSIARLRQSVQLPSPSQEPPMPPSRSGSVYTLSSVTPEDALWFSKLPDKIKRGYFSLEEERLLSAKQEELIQNTTVENISCLNQAWSQSVPSLQEPSSCISSIDESTACSMYTEDEEDDEEDVDVELANNMDWSDSFDLDSGDYSQILATSRSSNTYTPRSSSFYKPESSPIAKRLVSKLETPKQAYQGDFNIPQSLRDSHRRQPDEWQTYWSPNRLPPIPSIPETATIQKLSSRKASVVSVVTSGRRKSLKNLPSPITSIKEDCSITEDENRPGSIWVPGPVTLPTPPMTPPLPNGEPQATHYLDPEARLKLRMYLASASKFDEAVEFGFPSLPSPDKTEDAPFKPSTAASTLHRPGEMQKPSRLVDSPFRSRMASISTATSPVSSSINSSQSGFLAIPYSSISDHHYVATQERKTEVQAQLRKIDRDPYGSAGGREMTIRMTLTRPELRADEAVLYPSMQELNNGRPRTSCASIEGSLGLQDLTIDGEAKFSSGNQRNTSLRRLWSRK